MRREMSHWNTYGTAVIVAGSTVGAATPCRREKRTEMPTAILPYLEYGTQP